jgi:hypothetical protein
VETNLSDNNWNEKEKANFRINLIEPQGNTFTSTIRSKLMWGSDKRN